ncbi:MAG: hypothetical protein A2W90_07640 [Bacteroidetes bacterium GWF2_42_66]|nr:MAG: hypothetical protein A2W92_09555 [Bacteroidetes bacterium GWA2_42_15]OFX96595.1 MAG: hypothetical protein A2W89_13540 [Bacteroidetes bacterium GWE2_42_39]OFY45320.1 MAG: hypothetical protein A2W90_07640 [Bacteroidetes bacterium GWF2_42_66]HBL78409.1 hypothetical protein [Prolixibacteraceae bacterium]HCU59529.1 hypothetical protein [Prolixibacteraceae bacterium]
MSEKIWVHGSFFKKEYPKGGGGKIFHFFHSILYFFIFSFFRHSSLSFVIPAQAGIPPHTAILFHAKFFRLKRFFGVFLLSAIRFCLVFTPIFAHLQIYKNMYI